jgi:endonuclease/exonuclease/phosphatase family metal-dependent hydrolase
MRSLHVTTWNVLHRVHAVNWNEAPVEAFPDERVRIAGISAIVARWLASDVSVICLQEVSGDQLASLRRALGEAAQLFAHEYPRLPRLRGDGPPQLEDATEHLVTIVNAPSSRQLDARTFESDPGKGLLAVEVAGQHAVINTHVSFGDRREAQLRSLSALAHEATGGAIVLGDFNAPVDVVRSGLGEPLAITDLEGQRPTRVATHEHPPRTIDHVAVVRGTLEAGTVLDAGGLSDHDPVTATVLFA